jgi:pimeloyl-ACP methyl ester carboxylesterase
MSRVSDTRRSVVAVTIAVGAGVCLSAAWVPILLAQEPISFRTSDGWTIHADVYGTGERGVVLVHGGRFTKESWAPQARELVKAGFRVLAIDLRGYGMSKEGPPALNPGFGSPLDALGAVRYLRAAGSRTVSIVGGSMGADAAAGASVEASPGEIDRLVLLAGSAGEPAEKLKGRKLFVVARDDANSAGPRLPRIRAQFERAADPRELLILDGSAHAQFIFQTDQGDRLMRAILRFLLAP